MLRSEDPSPETGIEIAEAFELWYDNAYDVQLDEDAYDLHYENGQWWVFVQGEHRPLSDAEDASYSVVDAEGGDAVDGFSFEEV